MRGQQFKSDKKTVFIREKSVETLAKIIARLVFKLVPKDSWFEQIYQAITDAVIKNIIGLSVAAQQKWEEQKFHRDVEWDEINMNSGSTEI